MPAHGWTLVPGSETDGEAAAQALEEMGMTEQAALAREGPSFGASYQRGGRRGEHRQHGRRPRLSLNWF